MKKHVMDLNLGTILSVTMGKRSAHLVYVMVSLIVLMEATKVKSFVDKDDVHFIALVVNAFRLNKLGMGWSIVLTSPTKQCMLV